MKEYPKRENELRARTCECGHAWYQHSAFTLLPILSTIFGSRCGECMCKKFKNIGITTWEQRYYKKWDGVESDKT